MGHLEATPSLILGEMNDPLPQIGMEDVSNETGGKETSHRIDSHAGKELKKCL